MSWGEIGVIVFVAFVVLQPKDFLDFMARLGRFVRLVRQWLYKDIHL